MGIADDADRKRAARTAMDAAAQQHAIADREQVCEYVDAFAAEFAEAAPERLGGQRWLVGVGFGHEGWKTWVSSAGVIVFEGGAWEFVRPLHDKHEKGVWNRLFAMIDFDFARSRFVDALAAESPWPKYSWTSFREGGDAGEREITERGTTEPIEPDEPPRRGLIARLRSRP